jgi:ubiquitin-conjugating enzyme E2 W
LISNNNYATWLVVITGAKDTVYAGEKYTLKMQFSKEYPSKPPSVFFLPPVPRHVHVYTNGDICLNLLGSDWSPSITAESLVVSILSMLSSAKEKKLPPDNSLHADHVPGKQQENWMYHDEKC